MPVTANVFIEGVNPDIAKPLNIKRTALIERLQENLDEAKAEREALVAKQEAARQSAVQAIRSLSNDELYNFFARSLREAHEGLAARIKEAVEKDEWVTPKTAPTRHESALEKFVRVLTMSGDDVVEVTPNEEVYALL